jgi:ligand-binding sensor domain-containing protein/two-component sensor histidine kinase
MGFWRFEIIFKEKTAIFAALGWIIAFSSLVCAQKLPFKFYTIGDGLGHNRVNRVFQDKKGFLWFATSEGLSRFDGYEFTTYAVRDGLPNPIINDVLEDRQGRFWVAANDYGIALLNDKSQPENHSANAPKKFTKFLISNLNHGANKVDRLLIDSKDNLWCLTDDGIYRAEVSDNPVFTLVKAYKYPVYADASRALFEDDKGSIWFGIHDEIFEAHGDEIINHGFIDGDKNNFVINALQTKDGRIVVLSRENGLFEYFPEQSKWQKLSGSFNKPGYFYGLLEDNESNIWVGGDIGLMKFSGGTLTEYSAGQGLTADRVLSVFQDREGNLWSGTRSSGTFKLSDMSVAGYSVDAGETSLGIAEIDGKLRTFFCEENSNSAGQCNPKMRDLANNQASSAEKFTGILPNLRKFNLAKRGGNWVTFSEAGVFPSVSDTSFYFSDGGKIELKDFFDKPFKESDEISVYLNKPDVLWISKSDVSIHRIKMTENGNHQLDKFRWEFDVPAQMIGDGQGGLWLFKRGSFGGRLRNGNYESFDAKIRESGEAEGFEYLKTIPSQVSTAFLDSRGWIWLGTYYDGLFVCKNPADEKPVFTSYTTETDLLSDSVWAINEDSEGRIYMGTGRGLSRFNPQTDKWNSFTSKDGLIGDRITALFKDSAGIIWLNSRSGLTQINPKMEKKSAAPPPVYLIHIKIAGDEYPVAETGILENETISLDAAQNNLMIDFVGLQFKGDNALSYRHKLEGSDEDWSKPDKNRSISFANLAPGDYRFVVYAVNEDGIASAQPAAFRFKTYPPIYLRWWFLALAVLLVLGIIYAFYRTRLQKLLAVERTRTLIATDLHDDIGSNLSKISVLSEVVRLQLEQEGKSDDKLLSSIADISRQSVGSMSDIVWAINPKRDSVLEMLRKMREHAEEIFVPKGITVEFSEPEKIAKIKLPMDLRRDLYLIFKEAINNIAKHSNCKNVRINFDIYHQEIILQIEDDGIGFDLSDETNGNGLTNMKKRAERSKGSLQIESALNEGTKITVQLPQS